jgi:hypothetical protein
MDFAFASPYVSAVPLKKGGSGGFHFRFQEDFGVTISALIEFLAADPAARGPRGHNYAWNPENGTYRFPVHEFVRRARFWDGWRNMVEESVVLVEDQNSPKAIDSITRRMRFTADQLDRRAD